jgi:ribonucleotide reductase beta subunit family protein with ferritin-like domain
MEQHVDALSAALDGMSLGAHEQIAVLRAVLRRIEDRAPAAESAFNWAPGESDRLSLIPILHDPIWEFRKKIEACHWTAQEVDHSGDRKDWTTRMNADQRKFVRMQLAFFARVDLDVLKNINTNFGEEVDCIEAHIAYAAQGDQEGVHAESYGLQIAAVMDGDERVQVLNAARTMPVIGHMRDWVLRWFDCSLPVGDRLVAFAAVEGVLFSASFCAIQWLRELNLLPGIAAANAFIARDEGNHTELAALLIRQYLRVKPSADRTAEIFRGVIAILDGFVAESLDVSLIGMNADLMRQYIRFQADCVLLAMGYDPMWRVDNPFPFMDKLTLNSSSKSNFFERRPTEYQGITSEAQTMLMIDDTPVEFE